MTDGRKVFFGVDIIIVQLSDRNSAFFQAILNAVMWKLAVDCVWNVMAHAQKPHFVFRRNGRVHLNRQGRQFSRLLAAEVCASAVVMLDTPSSEAVKGTGYPLHSPVSPSITLLCVTVCHQVSTGLYDQITPLIYVCGSWWAVCGECN